MKNLGKIFFALSFVLMMGGCTKDFLEVGDVYYDDDLVISEYVVQDDELTILSAALIRTNLDLVVGLNQGETYTLFAPTDSAFMAYFDKQGYAYSGDGIDGLENISDEDLTHILSYHIVQGTVKSDYFEEEGYLEFSSDSLFLNFLNLPLFSNYAGGSSAAYTVNKVPVRELDIEVNNGMIIKMDGVIGDLEGDILTYIAAEANYSLFYEAIQATGYDPLLVQTDDNSERYTLLVEPNSLFAENGINSLSEMAAYFNADDNYLLESNSLNRWIAYHIIKEEIPLNSFDDVENSSSFTYHATALKSSAIVLSQYEDAFVANDRVDSVSIDFFNANFINSNGVVHELQSLLTYKSYKHVFKFEWDAAELKDKSKLLYGGGENHNDSYYSYYYFSSSIFYYDSNDLTVGDYVVFKGPFLFEGQGYEVEYLGDGTENAFYDIYINGELLNKEKSFLNEVDYIFVGGMTADITGECEVKIVVKGNNYKGSGFNINLYKLRLNPTN